MLNVSMSQAVAIACVGRFGWRVEDAGEMGPFMPVWRVMGRQDDGGPLGLAADQHGMGEFE